MMEAEVANSYELEDCVPSSNLSCSLSSLSDSLDDHSLDSGERRLPKTVSRLPIKTKISKFGRSHSESTDPAPNCTDHAVNGCGSERGRTNRDCQLGKGNSSFDCNGQNSRETITSRMRIEKSHLQHGNEADADEYMTPTQRKDQSIRDLKRQVKELLKLVDEKDQEIDSLKKSVGQESKTILEMKNKEILAIRTSLNQLETEHQELSDSYTESVQAVNCLQTTLTDLKIEMEEREKHHNQMYLETYEKGKQSAVFEREDELEMLAKSKNEAVTRKELIKKLTESQSELAKWQSLQRQEMYTANDKEETDAEARLKFLKDSFFHFLVSDKDSDDHLRAMVQIFNFSDVQKKMMKALTDRKRATGIAKH